jgi:hypothetical protein
MQRSLTPRGALLSFSFATDKIGRLCGVEAKTFKKDLGLGTLNLNSNDHYHFLIPGIDSFKAIREQIRR